MRKVYLIHSFLWHVKTKPKPWTSGFYLCWIFSLFLGYLCRVVWTIHLFLFFFMVLFELCKDLWLIFRWNFAVIRIFKSTWGTASLKFNFIIFKYVLNLNSIHPSPSFSLQHFPGILAQIPLMSSFHSPCDRILLWELLSHTHMQIQPTESISIFDACVYMVSGMTILHLIVIKRSHLWKSLILLSQELLVVYCSWSRGTTP